MSSKKLQEKRADQAELKRLRRVSMTFEASEEFLSRLAALLVFSTVPYELEEAKPLGPLPWENPNDPRFQKPPEPEIDYNAVRNDIMKAMDKYLTASGDRQVLVNLIQTQRGTKLSDVPKDNLLHLLDDINRLNQSKDA